MSAKGISDIIAVLLMLIITIGLAGLAYPYIEEVVKPIQQWHCIEWKNETFWECWKRKTENFESRGYAPPPEIYQECYNAKQVCIREGLNCKEELPVIDCRYISPNNCYVPEDTKFENIKQESFCVSSNFTGDFYLCSMKEPLGDIRIYKEFPKAKIVCEQYR